MSREYINVNDEIYLLQKINISLILCRHKRRTSALLMGYVSNYMNISFSSIIYVNEIHFGFKINDLDSPHCNLLLWINLNQSCLESMSNGINQMEH